MRPAVRGRRSADDRTDDGTDHSARRTRRAMPRPVVRRAVPRPRRGRPWAAVVVRRAAALARWTRWWTAHLVSVSSVVIDAKALRN